MWRAILQNKRYKEWVDKRERQLQEDYKYNKLDIGWDDIIAMIIAAFQVLLPIFLLIGVFITLSFIAFNFILK